jgi:DNA repair exonuclease SbcCD ATPase subunit
LTGFSIGGEINKSEDAYDDNLGETIRVIKDYDLIELSIVDNPANQYANVFSIEKGQASGLAVDTQIESIYYCADDNLVQLSQDSGISCPKCDSGMESIGFVESNDVDKADVIKSILSTVKSEKEVSKMEENTTETVEKADEAEAPVAEVEKTDEAPAAEVEETAKAEEEAEVEKAEEEEEAVEKAEVAEEAPSQEADVEKADTSADVVSEIAETTKASMDEMTKTVSILADTVKALNSKVEELNKQVTGVRSEMAENQSEFGKRVTAVEKETAFRKSGDLGQVVQEPIKVEKARAQSLWGGRFLTTDLFN